MDDINWPPKPTKNPKPLPRLEDNEIKQNEPIVIEPELNQETEIPNPLATTPVDLNLPTADSTPTVPTKVKGHKRLYFKRIKLSKKSWALVAAALIVLLGGGAYGAKYLFDKSRAMKPEPPRSKIAAPTPTPVPTTGPSPLTGVEVDLKLTTRPVTGVMIENSLDARPQSGLLDAGIVYEAIAEGGITRFLALYQEARPGYIGPVRSVRPYYLDFLMPFSASVAHVGGAPQALQDIKTLGIRDLDQFANGNSYQRISQRYAPHNVYTDFDKLDALNSAKSFVYAPFSSFTRKKETPSTTPNATTVDVAISGSIYDSHYDYDKASNSYKRSEGGKAHTDERSGRVISPKVVIALVMSRGIDKDGQHTDYSTTTGGQMLVFQDGIVATGTWAKSDRSSQFVFSDAESKPMKLNPGQTWITLVDSAAKVTYK